MRVPADKTWAPSPAALRIGWAMSGLVAAFMLFDGIMKVIRIAPVVKAMTDLGFDSRLIIPVGILCTLITILYLVPRTCVLGAALLTGYLGGAILTHVYHIGHGGDAPGGLPRSASRLPPAALRGGASSCACHGCEW